jgi:hypothetical protein
MNVGGAKAAKVNRVAEWEQGRMRVADAEQQGRALARPHFRDYFFAELGNGMAAVS